MGTLKEFLDDKGSALAVLFLVVLLGTKLLLHLCSPSAPPPPSLAKCHPAMPAYALSVEPGVGMLGSHHQGAALPRVELMSCHYDTLCEGVLLGR